MKILSLNLCTTMPGHPRKERLTKVAQFIEANEVDVFFFQEGLNICWPVYSTPRAFADWGYVFHKPYIGVPLFYNWRVGVMSVFPVCETFSLDCEVPQKAWLDSLPLPGRRRAVAVTVDVPGVGIVALASVHLSSSPKTEIWRQEQVAILLDWIKGIEADQVILGGDFNFGYDNLCYSMIKGRGFIQLGESAPDFIFANKGSGGARIVLNDGTVTDHQGGVLVEWKI